MNIHKLLTPYSAFNTVTLGPLPSLIDPGIYYRDRLRVVADQQDRFFNHLTVGVSYSSKEPHELDIDIHTSVRGIPVVISISLKYFTLSIRGKVLEEGLYTFNRSNYGVLTGPQMLSREMLLLVENKRRELHRSNLIVPGSSGFSGYSGVSGAGHITPGIQTREINEPPPITIPRPTQKASWLQRIFKGDK